jgi:hypothetical protein
MALRNPTPSVVNRSSPSSHIAALHAGGHPFDRRRSLLRDLGAIQRDVSPLLNALGQPFAATRHREASTKRPEGLKSTPYGSVVDSFAEREDPAQQHIPPLRWSGRQVAGEPPRRSRRNDPGDPRRASCARATRGTRAYGYGRASVVSTPLLGALAGAQPPWPDHRVQSAASSTPRARTRGLPPDHGT